VNAEVRVYKSAHAVKKERKREEECKENEEREKESAKQRERVSVHPNECKERKKECRGQRGNVKSQTQRTLRRGNAVNHPQQTRREVWCVEVCSGRGNVCRNAKSRGGEVIFAQLQRMEEAAFYARGHISK